MKHLIFSVLHAFKDRKQNHLRKLNDRILNEAAVSFTRPFYRLAVISYVLAKIVQKPRFMSPDYRRQLSDIESALARAASAVERDTEADVLRHFKDVERAVLSLEKRDMRFLTNLMQKGELKMAATMYAQGMSLGVAAEMTGMDKQEIMSYAGETMMFDRMKEEVGMVERVKLARRFIGEHA